MILMNPEGIETRERFAAYTRGWVDGASAHAMRGGFMSSAKAHIRGEYECGFIDGGNERREAHRAAAERLGFTPSILRGEP